MTRIIPKIFSFAIFLIGFIHSYGLFSLFSPKYNVFRLKIKGSFDSKNKVSTSDEMLDPFVPPNYYDTTLKFPNSTPNNLEEVQKTSSVKSTEPLSHDLASSLYIEKENDIDEAPIKLVNDKVSLIESVELTKSVIDMTSLIFRGDLVSILGFTMPMILNMAQMIMSTLVHSELFSETILPALALYIGNILFIIFL